MSKIVKAHELGTVTPFDFRKIEEIEGAGRYGSQSKGRGKSVEGGKDPRETLEETIQKRFLEAERKAEEVEREAYERGYAQGQKDGTEYGVKSMLMAKERLEQLIEALQGISEKALHDYREWLLKTCLAIARRIVGKELSLNQEPLIELIGSLLDQAKDTQSLIVYVNPKDLKLVQDHTDLREIGGQAELRFLLKPDPELERGGCRLENAIQLLDASIETRFALLEETLFERGTVSEEDDSTS